MVSKLDEIQASVGNGDTPQFDLLFTSPPYYNITSYHYDQWLRLWMLGGDNIPSKTGGDSQNGFWSKPNYRSLLEQVFAKCASVLSQNASIYVRTDSREFTKETTVQVLKATFPDKKLHIEPKPIKKQNQT